MKDYLKEIGKGAVEGLVFIVTYLALIALAGVFSGVIR